MKEGIDIILISGQNKCITSIFDIENPDGICTSLYPFIALVILKSTPITTHYMHGIIYAIEVTDLLAEKYRLIN